MSTRKQYSPHCYDNFFVLLAKLLDYFKDAITTEENLSFQFFFFGVCLPNFLSFSNHQGNRLFSLITCY